ncbi:MAG: nucleotidyltransferase family protein [Betaproteobacteria bacterium]|nr:nucleotidyltransferase family protein [Betaproteobacteria bacterium]
MILAAGRGERMRPLTDRVPKPLLVVRGRPLIEWMIAALTRARVTELVINHAHLGARIVEALGRGERLGVSIRYSPEREALETAGGVAQALHLLGDSPFLVVNSDVYCDYDFSALAARATTSFAASDDLAHLVMVDNPDHHPQGDFALAGGRIAERGAPEAMRTFSGIGLYSPRLFSGITPGQKAPLAPLLRKAMAAGRVGGERHAGLWRDVGTPERLATLNALDAA